MDIVSRVASSYERFFSLAEIRESVVLRLYFGASLFFTFITFYNWVLVPTVAVESVNSGAAVCWPYFQRCHEFFFFHDTRIDDSRGIFYAILLTVLVAAAIGILRNRWTLAHAAAVVLFAWEALVVFAFSYSVAQPYYYYHLILTAILLFIPHKLYFLKFAFVFLYFMSVTVKFDPGWILGTYFSSLAHGLPLVPRDMIPIASNLVIFSQVVGCWFLLARHPRLQAATFYTFLGFHLYSSILIFYMFPAAVIPPLVILFGPLYRYTAPPVSWSAAFGWAFIACIALFQILGFVTPGDRRLTLEGNKFGMFMFEANHQCVATIQKYEDGTGIPLEWKANRGAPCASPYCKVAESVSVTGTSTISRSRFESGGPSTRCDPYEWWFRLQQQCTKDTVTRISLQFDHSINGGPFYRIVDASDICGLGYAMFRHNDWIRVPPEAQVIGYPVTNIERD